jgi:hypothetical protein
MTSRLRRRARWKACSEPSNGNLGFASSTPALKPNCSLKCAADHGLVADVFFRRRQDHHETGLLRRRPGTLSNRVPPCAVVCKFCAVAPSARAAYASPASRYRFAVRRREYACVATIRTRRPAPQREQISAPRKLAWQTGHYPSSRDSRSPGERLAPLRFYRLGDSNPETGWFRWLNA